MVLRVKVVKVLSEGIEFDNGLKLYSYHQESCCESHYLWFNDISLDDFDGLEFDLSNENFFERIIGYGIALKPIFGHPVRVPGYGENSGEYDSKLELIISDDKEFKMIFDISECQDISTEHYRN